MDLEKHLQPKTVRLIYEAIERDHKPRFSRRLGASVIGDPCARKIWYGFRHVAQASFDGRMLRLFETGHSQEARIIADLRRAGVTVYDVDDTGEQHTFTACDGHFVAKLDGVAIGVPDSAVPHLLEIKALNEKNFNLIKKDGLYKSKPVYWGQCHINMHLAGVDRCLLIVVNKNTDEIWIERIKLDVAFAMQLLAKAEKIIYAEEPPARLSDDPSFYLCKFFCDYWNVCHAAQPPEVNCRTCAHSTPERGGDGKWSCALGRNMTPCEKHLFNPHAMGYKVADAGEDWVEYIMPETGEIVRNHDGNSQAIRDKWVPF